MNEHKINIQNANFSLVRLKLRGWSWLEGLKNDMDIAISKNDYKQTFHCMVKFIEMAMVPYVPIQWDKVPWYEFIEIYSKAIELNSPTIEFPILKGSKVENKKLPWEYPGRSWYFWLNLFARNYGWPEETIAEMDIDTAIGAYQEVVIDDQLQKEWEWGLSEIAYPYNQTTKNSEFKKLDRPDWMMPIIPKEPQVIKMKKSFLPQGNIIDLQGEELAKREKRKKARGI